MTTTIDSIGLGHAAGKPRLAARLLLYSTTVQYGTEPADAANVRPAGRTQPAASHAQRRR
jgi:hypothetical protein